MDVWKRVEYKQVDTLLSLQDFSEKVLGYTEYEAVKEAKRCIQCKTKPCMASCPAKIKIPEFIDLIAKGQFLDAYYKIQENNKFSLITGKICPSENQCESTCVRGIKGEAIAINKLERFVSDYALSKGCAGFYSFKPKSEKAVKKVCVIGSGPAGLSCALELALLNIDVTVYEKFNHLGGVLSYGIPRFRLPNTILNSFIDEIKKVGVKFNSNFTIGKDFSFKDIQKEYDAVFIGVGCTLSKLQNISGEEADNVYPANEFLRYVNFDIDENSKFLNSANIDFGQDAVVVGGGNVAMDVARVLLRLKVKNVTVCYRRREEDMPARSVEVHEAKEEGVKFSFLTKIVEIVKDDKNRVECIKCIKTQLGEDGKVKDVDGSEFYLKADTTVIAIGSTSDLTFLEKDDDVLINSDNLVMVEEGKHKTNSKKVFAAGDVVTSPLNVIKAVVDSKNTALEIKKFLFREQ